MSRIFLTLLLLAGCFSAVVPLQASRPGGDDRCERLFRWLQQARGDSLYAAADSVLRTRLQPAQLSALWSQVVAQGGALRASGAWERRPAGGFSVAERRLDFERMAATLRFVFNGRGELAGLFVLPARPVESADTVDWTERDTVVASGAVRLPATLCLPSHSTGRVPLVVFVHGSGPNDRDETLGPNKLFADLAHALAGSGVASLRYDKRTRVYSGERFMEVSGRTDYDTEVVDDAVAALLLARGLTEVCPDSLFVVGHSLGAALAPRIAARAEPQPAGIVLLAAPARPFDVMLREQLLYLARLQGGDTSRVETDCRRMLDALPDSYLDMAGSYNAVATARGLSLPILVVQGGHDYQVTEADFRLWQQGLAGCPNVRFAFLPALDHLMRPLQAMATPADYARYVPVSPETVALLLRFFRGVTCGSEQASVLRH